MLRAFAVAALLVVSIWRGMPPQTALACSGGPDFDPIATSDVVVMGVITGWEKVDWPAGPQMFQPIRLTIAVERTLKGPHSATLQAFDVASLINDAQGPISGQWSGSSGACGAFNVDPAGKFVFLGLYREADGTLRTNLLRTFYVGDRDSFAGFRYERTREQMANWGLILPPSTGSGGLVDEASNDLRSSNRYQLATAALLSVTLLAAVARTRARNSRQLL